MLKTLQHTEMTTEESNAVQALLFFSAFNSNLLNSN